MMIGERGSLRLTWSWLWTLLALALLAAGAAVITAVALGGGDGGEVALAVVLIGFPALLGAFALGTLAVVMARPVGARGKAVRRWVLAFVGSFALLTGLATLGGGGLSAVALIAAGASALLALGLDLWRERGERAG